ncbi:MAG: sugar phosphate isomerase/epimerase [Planctomycetota bacterium]|nr:sugar phosphate isomerase/epimerase [Planctomycetota bacterium]
MFEYLAPSYAFAGVSLEEACDRVAALGLRKIDLWFVGGMCEHLPPKQRELDLPRIRRALAHAGLGCHALSIYGGGMTRELQLARLEQLRELGGRCLIRGSSKQSAEEVIEEARPVVERAEALGVEYLLENHNHSGFDRVADIEQVLGAYAGRALGLAFAPNHLHFQGEQPEQVIGRVAERIGMFYAWDWGAPTAEIWRDPSHQLAGTGQLDFPAMFRALKTAGHARPQCLFAHGIEHWPAQQAEDGLRRALAFCREVERELEAVGAGGRQ